MSAAFREAQQVAAMLRRSGYPDAQAAREYCIDGEVGPDGFYTYTVSVYAGDYNPEAVSPIIRSAFAKAMAR